MVGRSGSSFGGYFWPIKGLHHDLESENRTTGSNHESLVLEVPRDEEVTHELAPAQIKSFFNRLLAIYLEATKQKVSFRRLNQFATQTPTRNDLSSKGKDLSIGSFQRSVIEILVLFFFTSSELILMAGYRISQVIKFAITATKVR
jgi:hypothetical protein